MNFFDLDHYSSKRLKYCHVLMPPGSKNETSTGVQNGLQFLLKLDRKANEGGISIVQPRLEIPLAAGMCPPPHTAKLTQHAEAAADRLSDVSLHADVGVQEDP
jgi:hypothetical protein